MQKLKKFNKIINIRWLYAESGELKDYFKETFSARQLLTAKVNINKKYELKNCVIKRTTVEEYSILSDKTEKTLTEDKKLWITFCGNI